MSLLTRKLNERLAALQGLVVAQQREIEALHDLADARAQVIEAMTAGYAVATVDVHTCAACEGRWDVTRFIVSSARVLYLCRACVVNLRPQLGKVFPEGLTGLP